MAEQTFCPACGAPLEYTGPKDIVNCGFCNTELRVIRENGEVHFRVLSQPEPQKEVLSNLVEPLVETPVPGAEIFDLPGEHKAAFGGPTIVSNGSSFTPPPGMSEGAQVYQPVSQSSNKTRNWILIAVGIILGVCLLCACTGVVLLLVFNASGSSF